MALPPQKFRELVFQLLFSEELGKPQANDMQPLMMEELAITKKSVVSAQERVKDIQLNLAAIDKMITDVSTSYDLNRIHAVIRNILRLGIYELFFDTTIPPRVAIAEAMRLARKFGTPESSTFVNALLDHLYQASQGQKMSGKDLAKTAQDFLSSEEKSIQAAKEAARQQEDQKSDDDDA